AAAPSNYGCDRSAFIGAASTAVPIDLDQASCEDPSSFTCIAFCQDVSVDRCFYTTNVSGGQRCECIRCDAVGIDACATNTCSLLASSDDGT
ncbi:MAG: hypothetical protein HC923_04465, partial [Myxococcales bacterium]|nr:hypothetical protein [Myxococcales bacterium]